MYYRYYGLSRPPFDVTPDPSMLFLAAAHREVLATLIAGVEGRKGFMVFSGEVGTGKTTILRYYFDQADPKEVEPIFLFTPEMTPPEMTRYLCRELGVKSRSTGYEGIHHLQAKLFDIYEQNRTVVLIVDEAQTLPMKTIEHLRLISNMETTTDKLLQVILVGPPELDAKLVRHEMRQVNQRVTLRRGLTPLSHDESVAYIIHRLNRAGAPVVADIIADSAIEAIAEAAEGVPRRINILADNVFIAGYGGEQKPIGGRLARAIIKEYLEASTSSQTSQRQTSRRGLFRWLGN